MLSDPSGNVAPSNGLSNEFISLHNSIRNLKSLLISNRLLKTTGVKVLLANTFCTNAMITKIFRPCINITK